MVMEYKVEQRVRLRWLKDGGAAAGGCRGVVKVESVRRDVPWLLRPYLILAEPVARLVKTHESRRVQFLGQGGGERERERGRARNGVGIVKSGKLCGRAQSMSSNEDT